MGQCGSNPCKKNQDCPFDPPLRLPVCKIDKLCHKMGWCPENIDKNTQIHIINDAINTEIQIFGVIEFPQVSDMVYQTTDTKHKVYFPQKNFNRIKMSDILQITNQNHGLLKYQGGEFDLKLIYDCDIGYECFPSVKIDFVNTRSILNPLFMNKWQTLLKKIIGPTEEGWNYQTLNYFEQNSFADYEIDLKRHYQLMIGYKINIEVIGVGKQISVFQIILNIAIGVIINILISKLCDFILMNFYNKYFIANFVKAKFTQSSDFSDLRDGINLIENN